MLKESFDHFYCYTGRFVGNEMQSSDVLENDNRDIDQDVSNIRSNIAWLAPLIASSNLDTLEEMDDKKMGPS